MFPLTAGTVVQTKELWDELHASLQELPVRVLFETSEAGEMGELFEKIDRMRPEVLFMDISTVRESPEQLIRGVRATSAAPAVLALNTGPDSKMILNAMRSGASEYLYPPFGEQVRAALERIGNERKSASRSLRRGGHTAGFVSAKGGCGATTIACHAAIELPQLVGGKVLLADLDFDAGMISFLLKSKSTYSISDAAQNIQRLDENYWRALVSNGYASGLEIISAPPPCDRHPLRPEQLRSVLSFARAQYDWTLVDLGRSLNYSSLAALEEIDELFLVTTLDVPALHRAKMTVQKLREGGYGPDRVHLLLNRAPKHFDVTLAELEGMLGTAVYATIPSDYESLNESYSEGKLLAPGADLRRHFAQLARKIAGVDEQQKTKKRFAFFG